MIISRIKLSKYTVAAIFAWFCVLGTVIAAISFISIGEACVDKITCEEWYVPLLFHGMLSLFVAVASACLTFIYVSEARARAAQS